MKSAGPLPYDIDCGEGINIVMIPPEAKKAFDGLTFEMLRAYPHSVLNLPFSSNGQSPLCGFRSRNASFPEPFRDTKIGFLIVWGRALKVLSFYISSSKNTKEVIPMELKINSAIKSQTKVSYAIESAGPLPYALPRHKNRFFDSLGQSPQGLILLHFLICRRGI